MVGRLELGRRNVTERFEQAATVVPCDPLSVANSMSSSPSTVRLLVLNNRITVSGSALSYESPVLPTDDSMPAWGTVPCTGVTPRSLWCTSGSAWISGDRRPPAPTHRAPGRCAARSTPAKPTIRRENTPMTNATYPRQVATYVRSAIHSWFGRTALPHHQIRRSGGRGIRDSWSPWTSARAPRPRGPGAAQAHHRTAGHALPFAPELLPDFSDAVDLAILPSHAIDVLAQCLVPPYPPRLPVRIAIPGLQLLVPRRGDRQHRADWLDPERLPVVVARPSLGSALELRLREIRRRRPQDLVRAPQLDVLAFELLEPRAFVRRQPGPPTPVTLGLPDPAPQRLGRTPDLLGDRGDRRPLRRVVLGVLEHRSAPLAPAPPGKTCLVSP